MATTVLSTVPPEGISSGFQDIPQYFTYPDNLPSPPFDKWIYFEARSGRHVLRNTIIPEAGGADRTLSAVGLYLDQTALLSALTVKYEQANLGAFQGALVEQFAQTGTMTMRRILGSGSADPLASALTAVSSVDVSKVKGILESVIAMTAQDAASALIGSASASVLTGFKVNPRTDILFDTQQYREHRMEFLMVPRTLSEAQSIDRICHFFQFYSLPKYALPGSQGTPGSFMIGFPYEFVISMRDANNNILEHINKIGRSVLLDVEINHAPKDETAFIKDPTGAFWPVATNLKLHWQEVVLLDRNSLEIQRATTDRETPLPDPNL